MRISMVSEHASPLMTPGSVDAGGQNVHVAALSRALAARGHRVTVYTRRDDPETPTRVALCPGVDVVHVTAGPMQRVPKDELLPYMSELAQGLRHDWAADPPDVVHSHFWMSGLAALEAARDLTSPPPIMHTFHALGSVKRRYQGAADTSPAERAWIEPMVGRRVDTVIATCDDEVAELRSLEVPPHRIEVAPCGVDLTAFDPTGPTERSGAGFRILSIGRLVPRKGVDLVVRALAILRERGVDDIELEVVGSSGSDGGAGGDPEIARLADLARELGVADRVHLRGQVPRETVPSLLRSADVVACTPWYEPFGIVPLESMACGTPIIAASVGGLADTVLDGVTGIHVPPHDPRAIADAVERMRADAGFRRALGAAGRLRVEARYTWERVAARTEHIYERALARRGALSPKLQGVAL